MVAIGNAGALAQSAADDEVYVYTNADLEALDPIPSQDAPLFEHDLDFNEIQSFIADHLGRLQNERQFQIERSLVEDTYENRRPGYGLALAPWGFWGRGKSRAQRIFETSHTDYANRIVPLHARTSLIEPLLNNSTRIRSRTGSGRDAMPLRQRSSRGSGRTIIRGPRGGGAANGPSFNTRSKR